MYIGIESPGQFATTLAEQSQAGDACWVILLAEAHQNQLNEIIQALNRQRVRFYGAVFPGLIQGRQLLQRGAIVQSVTCIGDPAVGRLDAQGVRWLNRPLPVTSDIPDIKPTLHLFVDCLSPHIARFLSEIFNHYGNLVNYFGAGTGNRHLISQPSVFTAQGIYENAVVAALVATPCKVSFGHGWQRLAGPFVATRTDNNLIQEIDWDSALEVYREALPVDINQQEQSDEWLSLCARHPFGIQKEGGEDVIRDPRLITAKGELACHSAVAENSVMYLEYGEPDRLIAAAGETVEAAADQITTEALSCLVFDCYSRTQILADDFIRELELIDQTLNNRLPGLRIEGALSLSEIVGSGDQSLEIYNKTLAISISHE